MNPLTELIPAQYRKYVYALATVAVFVYGLFQAAGGDWKTFAASLLGALVSALAASNTVAPESDVAVEAHETPGAEPGRDGFVG